MEGIILCVSAAVVTTFFFRVSYLLPMTFMNSIDSQVGICSVSEDRVTSFIHLTDKSRNIKKRQRGPSLWVSPPALAFLASG